MIGGKPAARSRAELALTGALLLGAVLLERARNGLELQLVALALALAGPATARLLAALERGPVVPLPVTALEVLALGGAFAGYPPLRASSFLAALAALLSLRRWGATDRRAGVLEELLVTAAALVALAAAFAARAKGTTPLALVLVLALEAFGPFASRLATDTAPRVAAFGLAAAAALVHGREAPHEASALAELPELVLAVVDARVPLARENVLLLGAALASGLALLEVPLRGLKHRTPLELSQRRRRLAVRGLAIVIPFGLFLLAGEVLFRIVPNRWRNRTLGKTDDSEFHKAGTTYTYLGPPLGVREEDGYAGNTFTWNKDGFHDVDHAIERPPGCARVVVLGDSYVEGVQLKTDELYHRQLERGLAAATPPPATVETLAFGWSGWGQAGELLALGKWAKPYRAQLVLAEFLPGNDVRNNNPELEDFANGLGKTFAARLGARTVASGLAFGTFLSEKLHLGIQKLSGQPTEIDSEAYRTDPPRRELWEEAWRRTDVLFEELARETRAQGAELAIVVFPTAFEARALLPGTAPRPGYDLALPARRASELCRKHGIPCLDLTPRFAARGEETLDRIGMRHDGHWGRLGQALAAEETARWLTQETSLFRDALARAARP